MSTTESYLRDDVTWKGIAQALVWSIQGEKEILKARMYESLMRFPIIDWEYAHKRALYHSVVASLILMKAVIILYNPSSKLYRNLYKMMTDIVDEWAQLYE